MIDDIKALVESTVFEFRTEKIKNPNEIKNPIPSKSRTFDDFDPAIEGKGAIDRGRIGRSSGPIVNVPGMLEDFSLAWEFTRVPS
jgi:hypothetical protein